MPTSKTWNNTSYSIPAAGELNWSTLSNFLNALADNAQTTNFQMFATRIATSSPVTVSATTDCVVIAKLTVPAAVAVTLPAGVTKQVFAIVDGTGDAASNNITITPAAGTINGAATYVISTNRAAVVLVYSGSEWVVAADTSTGFITRTSTDTGANRLQNKDLDDDSVRFVDSGDTTKKLEVETSGQTTGTTTTLSSVVTSSKTFIIPDGNASDNFVLHTTTQNLTNKNLGASSNTLSGATSSNFINTGTISLPTTTDTLIGRLSIDQGANRVKNKDFEDANTKIVDDGNVARTLRFELGSQGLVDTVVATANSSAATITLPNATSTVATTSLSESLTNKNLASSTNTLTGATAANFTNTGTISLPTSTDTLVGKATTDSLTNKALDDATTTITRATSRVIKFDLSGQTNSTTLTLANVTTATKTFTIPDGNASDNFVLHTTTQNLTNKNLGSSTNTLTGATAGSFTNTGTITLPTTTTTLAGLAVAETFTALQTFTGETVITGRTSGVAPTTGIVGETISAQGTNVATNTSTATTIATATLTTGNWLVSAAVYYENATGTGSNNTLDIKGSTGATLPDVKINIRSAANYSTGVTFPARMVTVASGDADKTIKVSSLAITNAGAAYATIYATLMP